MVVAILCAFAFLAGVIDAIAGGGGLIQLPPLLIFMAGVPHPVILGTNKLAAVSGTLAATVTYVRAVPIPWMTTLVATFLALLFSFLGARTVAVVPHEFFMPIVLVLLILVAAYTVRKKNFGMVPQKIPTRPLLLAMLIGASIGFYDGFFGPGTGSFLIFMFVSLLGETLLVASASAKIVNLATNLGALVYFLSAGDVRYEIALPMAVCNIAGGFTGAKLATRFGAQAIRPIFLTVVTLFILKIGYDLILTWH